MSQQYQFLDANGMSRYSDSIAGILNRALSSKANADEVITIDYVDNNFVKNATYAADTTSIWNAINTKVGSDYSYSKEEMNTILSGYLPQPGAGEHYLTNDDLAGYATQAWVNTTLEDYATQTWVTNQDYATQSWVLSLIPDMSDYYTISQITDILTGYAQTSVVNNLSNQLTALSNTVNNYIVNGGGASSGSEIVDLNNLYYWVNLSPNAIVLHSGTTLESDPTPYGRCFVTADMYRRNTTLFPLVNYEMKLSAGITVNNISRDITGLHQDFSQATVLSTYCDQTVKNYFSNELMINNDGIYTSTLSLLLSNTSWNTFIANFRDNYYKDINDNYNSHISSSDPTKTWTQEDEDWGWTEEGNYNTTISSSDTLAGRRAFLASKLPPSGAVSESDINERLAYLDQFLNSGHDKSLFEYLVLDPSIILSGTLNVTIWPYNKVDTQTGDPDDPSWEDNRYTWRFNYKVNSWDDEPSELLEIRLYDSPTNTWTSDSTANNIIKSIYNSKGYYTQLKTNLPNYLNDQKYVNVYCEEKSSDNKYYFTYGEGLSKLSILKSDFISMLEAFNGNETSYFHILYNGVELDSSVQADLDIITNFISGYLVSNDERNIDPMLTSMSARYGQNIIYGYEKSYPQSHDLFDFLEDNSSVKSLGGKTGDITFNTGTLSSNEVEFRIGSDNVLHGFVSSSADVNPVGVIFIWPGITGLTPPADYLLCDGSNYSQTDYSTLYSIIGSTYNDVTTQSGQFRVPDMRGLITGMNFIIKY